jgi:hypothetical protein
LLAGTFVRGGRSGSSVGRNGSTKVGSRGGSLAGFITGMMAKCRLTMRSLAFVRFGMTMARGILWSCLEGSSCTEIKVLQFVGQRQPKNLQIRRKLV